MSREKANEVVDVVCDFNIEFNKLKGCCGMYEDFTFVGADGKRHEMVREDDFVWHSGITNEEYLTYNDTENLEKCKKCSMWEICREQEYTKITENDVNDKLVDDITQHINRNILENEVLKRFKERKEK